MRKKLFFIFIALFCLHFRAVTWAHDLLPRDVVDFLASHPDASPAEIERFVSENSPELTKKAASQDELINLLTRETNFIDNSLDFLELGVEHILSGLDHILFVLTLLLSFTHLRDIFKFTGTFTVAHTITLLLAGSGILVLSPRLVEPLIAFSISYLALTSVFFQRTFSRDNTRDILGSIFFFGLFHGLGFAGLLQEIHIPEDRFASSLLFFNVGIEVGQLIIVAAALPALYYFRQYAWYNRLVKLVAIVIAALGIWWGVSRIVR